MQSHWLPFFERLSQLELHTPFFRFPGFADTADLRGWFAALGVDPRGMHSCDLGPALGLAFVGQTHNALHDARAIAGAMAVMASRGSRLVRPAA